MINEIMKLSADEIKDKYNFHLRNNGAKELMDELFYCFHKKSGKAAKDKKRFEELEMKFRFELEKSKDYNKVDFDFLQKQKAERQLKHYNFRRENYKNISAGVLNMPRIKKSLRNQTTLLLYLLQWSGYENRKGLVGEWYKRGFIAASQSEEQIAFEFQVSERTIKRWIKELEDDGLLLVEKSGLCNVYVLGLVEERKDENGKTFNDEKYFYCGEATPYRLPDRLLTKKVKKSN